MNPTSQPPSSRERRFRETYGWRPAAARRCPRVAAGKRCVADSRSCICTAHPLLERPAIWHDATGKTIYTAKPVEPVGGVELSAFVADATAIGAYVVVLARSSSERSVLLEVGDASHTPFQKRRT